MRSSQKDLLTLSDETTMYRAEVRGHSDPPKSFHIADLGSPSREKPACQSPTAVAQTRIGVELTKQASDWRNARGGSSEKRAPKTS